jgi:diguanylate cyclase (GGDEF)-like protein
MELKIYLNILLRKWWIVIPTFLITLTSGIVFTYTRTPIYSATTTYIVAPSSSFEDVKSFASGLSILGQRVEIATTFAEVASSHRIKNLALNSLSLKSGREYSISSQLRRSTNIIEITAIGPDPVIARDLANAVGTTIEEYAQGLYEVFILVSLDEATTPNKPISPKTTNNLVLATILGLVLGGGLAFLAEYLETPLGSAISMNIIDSETGVYNKEYFSRRLSEEMVRARRNRYPLSLALMRVDNLSLLRGVDSAKIRTEFLRRVAVLTSQYLREEDIVAYLEEDIFALLLPDMTGENAKALMEYLQTRLAWTPIESNMNGTKFNLKGIVGITTYNHNGTSRDNLMAQASQALQLAEVENDGRAFLITNNSSSGDNAHAS